MELLTRHEEMVLLAVWKLQENAYGVPLARELSGMTNQEWVLGAVYTPLERLERKGYLSSFYSDPTKERGGRKKRIYKLTRNGLKALLEIKRLEENMWMDISRASLQNEI